MKSLTSKISERANFLCVGLSDDDLKYIIGEVTYHIEKGLQKSDAIDLAIYFFQNKWADNNDAYKNNEFIKERVDKQFYIDTEGKIHKYNENMYEEVISFHYQIAKRLYPDVGHAEDFVMNLGWILCGSSCYHHPIIHKRPTQAQINTLHDLGLYEHLCFLHKGRYENFKKNEILCE